MKNILLLILFLILLVSCKKNRELSVDKYGYSIEEKLIDHKIAVFFINGVRDTLIIHGPRRINFYNRTEAGSYWLNVCDERDNVIQRVNGVLTHKIISKNN